MAASFLQALRAGPPPPKTVLLPDGLFFIRAVSVGSQEDPAEVAHQVEMALEAASPFPLAQLYHGHYWVPGSGRALAFAAYRRRFTPEQIAEWAGAEHVMPAFAALLAGSVEPATTAVVAASDGLTAIHWDGGPVPAHVRHQPLPPEATDEERAAARDALLRRFESKAVIDVAGPAVPESSRNDRAVGFHAGGFSCVLPADAADAIDIRDKDELRSYWRDRGHRRLAWRVLMGTLAGAGALALGELLLLAGGLWQEARSTQMHAQAPVVDQIMTAQSLTNRIEVLSTKQLLPLEMIGAIVGKDGERKPDSIQFNRATCASGQPVLTVEAQTDTPADIAVYQSRLAALPEIAKVEPRNVRTANNVATFTLVVTFKPGALKPGGGSST